MNLPPTIPYTQLETEQIGIKPPAFKLPDDVRLGIVRLQIANLERSLDYYQKVIGFEIKSRDDTPNKRSARLATLGRNVLLELIEKPGVRFAPHRGRLGIYHFALLLPTQGDLGRFLANALTFGHVGQSDHHYSEATYLVDPDGITIEVYRDRPREKWRVTSDGEVFGGSDPLDMAALKEAAGQQPWLGLPAGTIMGHLHFYVGDLQQAEAFYHEGLGFSKMTWNFPGALFMGANGYHHHVGCNTWAAGSNPSTDDDARLLSWDLLLPDQTQLELLEENLKHFGFVTQTIAGGFSCTDPWGIRVCVKTAHSQTSVAY
jgi:catechol 2,3-dioxygenase